MGLESVENCKDCIKDSEINLLRQEVQELKFKVKMLDEHKISEKEFRQKLDELQLQVNTLNGLLNELKNNQKEDRKYMETLAKEISEIKDSLNRSNLMNVSLKSNTENTLLKVGNVEDKMELKMTLLENKIDNSNDRLDERFDKIEQKFDKFEGVVNFIYFIAALVKKNKFTQLIYNIFVIVCLSLPILGGFYLLTGVNALPWLFKIIKELIK